MRLSGKTALVTGGSRGIGKSIVNALAGEGANVAFVYRSNSEAAEQLLAELKSKNCEAMAFCADVKNQDEADDIVQKVCDKWDKLDIMVNNAGIIRDNLLAMMDGDQWRDVVETNLNSVYNFCHAVVRPMMSARYGRIINLSSVAAKDRKSTRLNSSHTDISRMPASA